jgi:hypothetical protein
MFERAVYNEERQEWYQQDNEPYRVLMLEIGQVVPKRPTTKADTYAEAFETLFGHPTFIPAPTRAPHRQSAFEVVER